MPRSAYPYTILNFKMATDPEHDGQVWLNWSWDDVYWTPNLDHWEIWPSYTYVDTNGQMRWMDMSSESVSQEDASARQWSFYWDLPLYAEDVKFRYRPIAKNGADGKPAFEEEILTTETKYFGGAVKPDKPDAPTVTQQSTLGIQVVLSLTNVLEPENNKNVVRVEFQTIQYNSEFDSGVILNTVQGYVDDFGNIQAFTQIGTSYGYKFRARLWASKARTEDPNQVTVVASDWSEFTSDFIRGVPEQPVLEVSKFSSTKVKYDILTNCNPHHFQLEIAPGTSVFDKVDEWETENPEIKEDSEARKAALLSLGIIDEITVPGNEPHNMMSVPASGQDFAVYRVRAVSAEQDGYYSSWSEVTEKSTLIFSDGLRAPIIWSATEFAEVGDPSIQLCVMHNSPNGSPSCKCLIAWSINSESHFTNSVELDPPSGQSGNTVYYFNLDLTGFTEETVIYWRAVTYEGNAPIEENRSPMSEIQHFAIHEKPHVELIFPDLHEFEEDIPIMQNYPLKYQTQTTFFDSYNTPLGIVSFEFNIISAETYRRYDKEGRLEVIKAGDVIWHLLDTSKYYDTTRELKASDCTLDTGVAYYFQVIVALSNGATSSNEWYDEPETKTGRHPGIKFKPHFEGANYTINCNHTINRETVALYLSPYAVEYKATGLLPTPSFEDEYWVPSYIGGSLGATYPGDRVWHVGDKTYYSSGSYQYEFNRESNEWIPKIWNGLTSFNGSNIWSDDNDVYYSSGSVQYVLNVDTDTWVPKTWNGLTSFYKYYTWSDGTDIYYSSDSQQYVLNKETSTWVPKTWYGLSSFGGNCVWTDGESMYISIQTGSLTATHYILDAQTSTWSIKTWEGNSFFTGDRVWTDGYNVYVSSDLYGFDSNQYKLNKDTDTWESITWEVHDGPSTYSVNLYAGRMWKDNGVIYLSNNGLNIKLEGIPQESQDLVPTYPKNVELAVYRKNDDGSFVKIDDNIPNTQSLFITDPHPNLAGAEYRIVATDTDSGVMTYYDPPPIDMGCTDIILQWDEDYANKPDNGDLRDFIPNLGNIVRLPYNIDVSESANIDNEMVKYIGRKDPVSYYGTQTGYTASWSTEIPKYDKETIKMLRKLQVYPGDVYVREPNGTGYWAHVTVTFPLNHCALTVSVSISVTRVEGGK